MRTGFGVQGSGFSKSGFTIRSYRESDHPALKEITVLAFDGVSIDQNIEKKHGVIAGKDWRFRKARHIDWDIAAYATGIFVAEVEGKPVGFIATRPDPETKIGSIPDMAVHPAHQGKGIGTALIKVALDYLSSLGMEYVRIETLEQNAVGQKLYPRIGFQEIARQIHYIMPLKKA
jgi:ribosomal protein S18 acetylase RimI-like enzyme